MERKELAIQLYKKGYSCAQAVACAYHDSLLLSEDAAYRISEGFGGGMGHYGHTCGACSVMVMVAGSQISKGYFHPVHVLNKNRHKICSYIQRKRDKKM